MTTIRDILNEVISEFEKRSSEQQSYTLDHYLTEEEINEIKGEVIDEYADIIKERIVG